MRNENGFIELFNQYSVEVGRYLPRRKRNDIQVEILSLLEDSLEDKSAAAGRQPDEDMVIEVLKEFGPPITFAENYHQDNTLIGPAAFPIFKPVLLFAMAVFLLQFVVGMIIPGGGPGDDFLTILNSFFDNGFQVFGAVVFAFALLERTTPAEWLRWPFKEMTRTWDPTGLMPDKRKLAVRASALWVEALFLVGLLVLLTVFPHWVGFGSNRNGIWNFVPVLSESFSVYLPWVVAFFLTKIGFNFYVAQKAFWDTRMRWVSVGVQSFGVLLLLYFLSGPEVFGLNPAYLALHNPDPSLVTWFESTLTGWNTGFRIYIVIQLIGRFIQLARTVFLAITGKQQITFKLR